MSLPAPRPRIAFMVALLSSVGGCGTAPKECPEVVDPGERVQCRIDQMQPLLGDYGQLELRMSEIPDDAEHDLVALRLMVQQPSLFPILCPHIRTTAARERCERLQERPHLSERARRPEGTPPP